MPKIRKTMIFLSIVLLIFACNKEIKPFFDYPNESCQIAVFIQGLIVLYFTINKNQYCFGQLYKILNCAQYRMLA